MKISRRQLAEVIGRQSLGVSDPKQLARVVAAYLMDHAASSADRYSGSLDSLMRDVMRYRMEHGVIEAVVVSAHGLNPVVLADISDLLRKEYPVAKSVVLRETIDPQVIGGVRLQLPNQQLDMTVKAKLNTLRRLTA